MIIITNYFKIAQFLTVPEGIPFQIKFGFPNDSESNCFSLVVSIYY